MTALLAASGLALVVWLGVLLSRAQPHRLRERLEPDPSTADELANVTVLIPARDEAEVIGQTIASLAAQGRGLDVIVVDDQSDDGTEAAASAAAASHGVSLRVLRGEALPQGWAGKLWALEQGLALVDRPYVLLLDADIELAPGMLPALLRTAKERGASLVSIMAELHCQTFWERLLTPAFVLFFKLIYPFAWSNDVRYPTAAAAGGCMLVRVDALRAAGGFAAIRDALIDDCTLAAELKRGAPPIWIGVSRGVRSLRVYATLGEFWRMVSRSAFTQLRYSTLLLIATTAALVAVLLAPVAAVGTSAVTGQEEPGVIGGLAWLTMALTYWPVVRFYRLPVVWALTLPFAGALFLGMTLSSALNYWRGRRATWKRRDYERSAPR